MKNKKRFVYRLSLDIMQFFGNLFVSSLFIWSGLATVFALAYLHDKPKFYFPILVGGFLSMYMYAALLTMIPDVEVYKQYIRDEHLSNDYERYKKSYMNGDKIDDDK